MVKAKFKTPIFEGVHAVVTISVDIPKEYTAALDVVGVREEERENLLRQRLAEILALLGSDDLG